MSAAANFAWTNRSLISYATRKAFSHVFGGDGKSLGMDTVYDVSHNIAKIEKHGSEELCVHRKGATRAFGPESPDIPRTQVFWTASYCSRRYGDLKLCFIWNWGAMEQTFGSTCHGAGSIRKKGCFEEI